MGSFSVNASSLHFGVNLCGTSISKHNMHRKIKPMYVNQRNKAMPLQICPVLVRAVDVSASRKDKCFDLHGLGAHFSKTACAFFNQKSFTSSLGEIAVKLIIGSLFFLASFNVRPAVALPAESSVNVEEGIDKTSDNLDDEDTRKGIVEDEDEELHLKLLEQDPRNVEALKAVVNIKIRKKKLKEAVEYVERLIDAEPHDVEWRLLEAFCYEMTGQLSIAKRLFKEILKERPLLLKALHGLAMVMMKNFEGPAVFQMLNKALELASREKRVPEERNIQMLIAQMHLVQGDLDEALRKFQDLVHQNPRDFRPYLCQGIIYSLQDKEKEAEEQFKIYQSLVPEEFPERGYLDDVVGIAKTEFRDGLGRSV
ncbi:hypothetical protein Dimus_017488 [Dionaea muscipula]